MPARWYSLLVGVGFRHPVTSLQVSFRAMSTCLAWVELYQTLLACSPAEKQTASAVVLTTSGFAPQEEFVIFRRMLFLPHTFILVIMECS